TAWPSRLVEIQYKIPRSGCEYTCVRNADDGTLFLDRRLVRPERTGLLPGSGVDTERFAPPEPQETPSPERPVTFLMVARLLADKGVYEFVEAARQVRRRYPNTQFQLLGRRDERNPRVIPEKAIQDWQSEGTVSWLGEVPDVRCILSLA